MKLNLDTLKYMSKDEWRVLTAIEMGLRNHEYVPMPLVEAIANLKRANCFKLVQKLLKNKLVQHKSKPYDGYTLTYLGYDYLAIKVLLQRKSIKTVKLQMGVGKESDVYLAVDENDNPLILKLTQTIQQKRDYIKHRTSWNWFYLSRLSAIKEFSYLKALYQRGIPTPTPVDYNRHAIVMSFIDGKPLNQIRDLPNPKEIYETLMGLLIKFVEMGIIHGDFNEFNLLLDQKGKVFVIDFPQIIPVIHPSAEFQFNRDVDCIQTFFEKRYNIHFESKPKLGVDAIAKSDLTKDVSLSGYFKELLGERVADIQMLESYRQEVVQKEGDVDDKEVEEESETTEPAKWETKSDEEEPEEELEEDDKDVAEERAPIDHIEEAKHKIVEDKLLPQKIEEERAPIDHIEETKHKIVEDKPLPQSIEEEKKGGIDLAKIKEKVKKQLRNTFKRDKVKRNKNKSKKKTKGKGGEKIYASELSMQ